MNDTKKASPFKFPLTVLAVAAAVAATARAHAFGSKQPAPDLASNQTRSAVHAEEDLIWVGKSDESKSCESAKGIGLDIMAAELQKAGAAVSAKRKVRDDKMRIQMCGADKGDMNGYRIAQKDLEKAVALGFSVLNPQPTSPGPDASPASRRQ
ncbi:MAG: hypothetical protein HYW49_13250 [Deltaproteobacteria bacterium]|nr:hypothetical protein [Deltaproteobacteria bacterium]